MTPDEKKLKIICTLVNTKIKRGNIKIIIVIIIIITTTIILEVGVVIIIKTIIGR